jgi:hypothetical protein
MGPLGKAAHSVPPYRNGHANCKQPVYFIISAALQLRMNHLEGNFYVQHQNQI